MTTPLQTLARIRAAFPLVVFIAGALTLAFLDLKNPLPGILPGEQAMNFCFICRPYRTYRSLTVTM